MNYNHIYNTICNAHTQHSYSQYIEYNERYHFTPFQSIFHCGSCILVAQQPTKLKMRKHVSLTCFDPVAELGLTVHDASEISVLGPLMKSVPPLNRAESHSILSMNYLLHGSCFFSTFPHYFSKLYICMWRQMAQRRFDITLICLNISEFLIYYDVIRLL